MTGIQRPCLQLYAKNCIVYTVKLYLRMTRELYESYFKEGLYHRMMNNNDNLLCMGCMSPLEREGICPHCGYDSNTAYDENYLPPGTVIASRYLVGALQSYNGEGAVYIGYDNSVQQPVWVREYFPYTISFRELQTGMIMPETGFGAQYKALMSDYVDVCNEVKRLSVSDPVIPIENVVGQNNTIYAIYKHLPVISLEEYLVDNGGRLPIDEAMELFIPLFNAVDNIHVRGVIHRGLSPYTIMVNDRGRMYLDAFSLSATRTGGSELQAELFNGYSAPEQYVSTGWQGTWTDVYALAAVFYRAVSGVVPPKSTLITPQSPMRPLEDLISTVTPAISAAVVDAMQSRTQERTQTVAAFTSALLDDGGGSRTAVFDFGREPGAGEYDAFPTRPATPVTRSQPRREPTASRRAAAKRPPTRRQPPTDDEFGYTEEFEDERPISSNHSGSGNSNPGPNWGPIIGRLLLLILVVGVVMGGIFLAIYVNENVLGNSSSKDESSSSSSSSSGSSSSQSEGSEEDDGKVTVPTFTGMKLEDVQTNSEYRDNFVFEIKEENDRVYPEGTIFQQSVAAATKVAPGTRIVLTVSKGAKTITMPDFKGEDYQDAYDELMRLGEEVGRSVRIDKYERISDTVDPGQVISTTPAAGEEFDPDDKKIQIYVAKEVEVSSSATVSSSAPPVASSSSQASSSKPSSSSSTSSSSRSGDGPDESPNKPGQ